MCGDGHRTERGKTKVRVTGPGGRRSIVIPWASR